MKRSEALIHFYIASSGRKLLGTTTRARLLDVRIMDCGTMPGPSSVVLNELLRQLQLTRGIRMGPSCFACGSC